MKLRLSGYVGRIAMIGCLLLLAACTSTSTTQIVTSLALQHDVVVCTLANELLALDLTNGKTVHTTALGKRCDGMAYHYGLLWLTNSGQALDPHDWHLSKRDFSGTFGQTRYYSPTTDASGKVSMKALDGESGVQQWQTTIPLKPNTALGQVFERSGVVFVGLHGFSNETSPPATYSGVMALDAQSGKILWSYERDPLLECLEASSDTLFCWGKAVYAFDARSGALRWQRPLQAMGGFLVGDGLAVMVDQNQTAIALDARTGATRWSIPITLHTNGFGGGYQSGVFYLNALDTVFAIDAATGKMRWSFADSGYQVLDLQFGDNLVYVESADTFALDMQSGKVVWKTPHDLKSAMVLQGNLLIASYGAKSQAGDNVVAFDPHTGAIVWDVPIPNVMDVIGPADVAVSSST